MMHEYERRARRARKDAAEGEDGSFCERCGKPRTRPQFDGIPAISLCSCIVEATGLRERIEALADEWDARIAAYQERHVRAPRIDMARAVTSLRAALAEATDGESS